MNVDLEYYFYEEILELFASDRFYLKINNSNFFQRKKKEIVRTVNYNRGNI